MSELPLKLKPQILVIHRYKDQSPQDHDRMAEGIKRDLKESPNPPAAALTEPFPVPNFIEKTSEFGQQSKVLVMQLPMDAIVRADVGRDSEGRV